MDSMKLPLSGDVSQLIAPWTSFGSWFVRSAGQLGLININIGATPAPDVESAILDEVGSYGRQIGRLCDAVEILVGTLDRNSLSVEQQAAISAFETQLGEVRAIKAREGRGSQSALASPPAKFR